MGADIDLGHRRWAAALTLLVGLAGVGCPTTHLTPNRRLEAGHVVTSATLDLGVAIPMPSRLGGVASVGLGPAELQASGGVHLFDLVQGAVGGRVYAGPVNVGARAGLVYDRAARDAPSAMWDVRITTASDDALPFYVGAFSTGRMEDGWSHGQRAGRQPRFRTGLLLGWEYWSQGWGFQAELACNLVEFHDGELGYLESAGPSDVAISGESQMLMLGLAMHYDVGG